MGVQASDSQGVAGVKKGLKPVKPAGSPLFPHASGKWAKKVNGQLKYFGRWDDHDGAIAEYRAFCGEEEIVVKALSVADGVNLFLDRELKRRASKEISANHLRDIKSTCKRILEVFGRERSIESLGPDDFARYKLSRIGTCNIVSFGNETVRVKACFSWLLKMKYIEEVEFGPDFRKPTDLQVRRHRRSVGNKTISNSDWRYIVDECGVHLRAMVHLAANCAYGPTDCARLDLKRFDGEWLEYPRTKTEVDRMAYLWPETIEAVKASIQRRPDPKKGFEHLLFVHRDGGSYDRSDNPISKAFRSAAGRAGLKRESFYWLRHTFETIAGDLGDQVAVNTVMGHVDTSMAAVYRHEVDSHRVIKVCNHVRDWIYAG